MTHTIIVENIKCGGCMNSIKTALLNIPKVVSVNIDKDTETVAVEADEAVDRETFVAQLAKMGYPEKGNNNLFLKAKSYVSCAIGNMTEQK